MPRPAYPLSDYLLHGLKWMIEAQINFRLVNKNSCEQLRLLMLGKSQTTVSTHTLYRIFLHPQNENKPYLHTLDLLAQFIDFSDWNQFCDFYQELYSFQVLSGITAPHHAHKSLLRFCIYNKDFKSVYPFLEQFSNDLSEHKKHLLGEEIYNILKQNPNSNIAFFKKFSGLPVVREGFFELMADPDFTIPQYEFGLHCYLNPLNPERSTAELQEYIFANALLLRHYFFLRKWKKVAELGAILYRNSLYDEQALVPVHVFPKIRYYAYYLLYRFAEAGFDHAYWERFHSLFHRMMQPANLHERRMMLHTCYETLGINPELQAQVLVACMQRYPENFAHVNPGVEGLSPTKVIRLLDPNAATYFQGQRVFQPKG